jgi:hypothetical protein
MVSTAHRVEVKVGADGHASAPLSGAAAAAPPAGAWQVLDQNAFRPDYDYGGYGGIGESLHEGSANKVFMHDTPGYNP